MSSRKRKQDEEEELVSLPDEEDGEEEEYISTGDDGEDGEEEEEKGDEEVDDGDEGEEDADVEEEDGGLNGDEADAKSASNGTNGVKSAEANNGIADVNDNQPPVKKRKMAGDKATDEAANGDATGSEDHVAKDSNDNLEAAKNIEKAAVAPIEAEEPEQSSTESAPATAVVGADDEDK